MRELNPTLWRTCRVLSGQNRLRLLRALLLQPELNVSQLANAVGVGVSDASQELRRLQSRGLLKRTHAGPAVIYRPVPDPQVPTAAPLLKAIESSLVKDPAMLTSIASTAKGLASEGRVAVARALRNEARTVDELSRRLNSSPNGIRRHLTVLKACGWVRRNKRRIELLAASHPVMAALREML